MAKAKAGRCVHCLQYADVLTNDHLFPRSWYPDSTPPNLEKWKFPACRSCNAEYGKIEETLLIRLAACVDPTSPASDGIWQRALDAMNPNRGRDGLDSFKRKMARQRFLRELRPVAPELMKYVLPEIKPERPRGDMALLVPARHLSRFAEKLVRGIVYVTEGRLVEDDHEVTVSLLKPDEEEPVLQILEQFGEIYERGPGIRIRKAVAADGATNALFVFDIWDQFRMYGAVMSRTLL